MRRALRERCFYLFVLMVLLIVLGPLGAVDRAGRIAVDVVNYAILVVAAVAVGRTRIRLALASLLAAVTIALEMAAGALAFATLLTLSTISGAIFYVVSIAWLLGYVFRREGITEDKLYGAAAAYLMIGVVWSYFYGLVQQAIPGSFSGSPTGTLSIVDLVYFSFTVLTSAGFGDILPLSPLARSLTVLEQIVGVLFVAILIARVAGIYTAAIPASPDRTPPPNAQDHR